MNIKVLVAGLAAVVVVGGGAYFFINNSGSNNNEQAAPANGTTVQSTASKTSLKELLARGDNLECTFDYTDEIGNNTTGTIYVASKKVRADMVFTEKDKQPKEYGMIRDETYLFTWDKTTNEGFKVKTTSLEASDSGRAKELQKQQTLDEDRQYEFDCSDWSPDVSFFSPPGNVKFTDFSAQLEKVQQVQQDSMQNLQKACAEVSDPKARALCEDAL